MLSNKKSGEYDNIPTAFTYQPQNIHAHCLVEQATSSTTVGADEAAVY
jgi:hypothetical protein